MRTSSNSSKKKGFKVGGHIKFKTNGLEYTVTELSATEVKLQGVGFGNPWKCTETIDTLVTSYTVLAERAHVDHDGRRVTRRTRVIAS